MRKRLTIPMSFAFLPEKKYHIRGMILPPCRICWEPADFVVPQGAGKLSAYLCHKHEVITRKLAGIA